ncbi:proline dehydrogenase/oxidase [Volvox carteri f. nagariensis]|uniref:Proline dehydrogenase n=1 Tax=Volvox carteri f. nagariensis TaxID=3068 RepID=D8UDI3_VOLCA|nr:proline dehydrogenase/oxidase [Volvox carteri f. nagariensis]EFJ42195.1 proline dehydrogenase/oxidase [Volvox carteri f. nagariensis]|eukprot:XP_002956738.1 proline dehydrogenase/oxidase [Volvox carteri f. nagariensis]
MSSVLVRAGCSTRPVCHPKQIMPELRLISGARLTRSSLLLLPRSQALFPSSRGSDSSRCILGIASISSLGSAGASTSDNRGDDTVTGSENCPKRQLQFKDHRLIYEHLRTDELVRTLLVLRLCSLPLFVRHVDHLLHGSTARSSNDVVANGSGSGSGSDVFPGFSGGAFPALRQDPSPRETADRGGGGGGGAAAAAVLPGALLNWMRDALFRHFCIGHMPSDVWSQMNRLRAHGVMAMLDFPEEDDATSALQLYCTPAVASAVVGSANCRGKQEIVSGDRGGASGTASPMSYDYDPSRLEVPYGRNFQGFMAAIDTAASLPGQKFSLIKLSALTDHFAERGDGGGGDGGCNGDQEFLVNVSAALHRVLAALQRRGVVAAAGDGRTVPYGEYDMDELLRRWDMTPPASAIYVYVVDTAGCQASMPESKEAEPNGVKVIIDAELSAMRPALEHIAHDVMRRYNNKNSGGREYDDDETGGCGGDRREAVVFLTYQAYLKDIQQRLTLDLFRAEREGYSLGANLVSGAYMHLERRWAVLPTAAANGGGSGSAAAAAATPSSVCATTTSPTAAVAVGTTRPNATACPLHAAEPALYDTVEGTHASFAACLELLLDAVRADRAELMVGTHHRGSVSAAAAGMARRGLGRATAPVYFGQLLGVADDISFSLGAAGFKVYKLCPFGHPDKVVPYLARRVYEMQYALQASEGQELQLAQSELTRRMLYGAAAAAGAAATAAAAKAAALLAAVRRGRPGGGRGS